MDKKTSDSARAIAESWPPLKPEQRDRLAVLLRPEIAAFVERELAKAPPLTPEQLAIIARAFNQSKPKERDEWDV